MGRSLLSYFSGRQPTGSVEVSVVPRTGVCRFEYHAYGPQTPVTGRFTLESLFLVGKRASGRDIAFGDLKPGYGNLQE